MKTKMILTTALTLITMSMFAPVSYTHLDVYKRQGIFHSIRSGAEQPAWEKKPKNFCRTQKS